MTVTLYKCNDDNRKIEKTLNNSVSYDARLKDETSLINPTLLLEISVPISSYNYMYIPDFGRYYFITDISSYRNNIWTITGHVDVLNTYKNEIRNCRALESRNKNDNSPLIVDNNVVLQNDSDVIVQKFSNTDLLGNYTGNMHYVLLVAGSAE